MNDSRTPLPACLAPWVHSCLNTPGGRKLCCLADLAPNAERSRLEDFWNGSYMRSVRQKMMQGNFLPECHACTDQKYGYFQHFNEMYKQDWPELQRNTNEDGSLRSPVVSLDYRTSNACNFKCQICVSGSSSALEAEAKNLGQNDLLEDWQHEPLRTRVMDFHARNSEPELRAIIESKVLREVYWTGGEPLLAELHWESMKRIVELGYAEKVFPRYNTNFSLLEFRGQHLFRDLLRHFPKFQILASLDATGQIGEYLRTGLQWKRWLKNLEESLPYIDQNQKTFAIDHRLTTLGILDLPALLQLGREHSIHISSKMVLLGAPQISLSPLSPFVFPKKLLERLVSETKEIIFPLEGAGSREIFQGLDFLLSEPNFQELYPEQYENSMREGMKRLLLLERHRDPAGERPNFFQLLSHKPYLAEYLQKFTN